MRSRGGRWGAISTEHQRAASCIFDGHPNNECMHNLPCWHSFKRRVCTGASGRLAGRATEGPETERSVGRLVCRLPTPPSRTPRLADYAGHKFAQSRAALRIYGLTCDGAHVISPVRNSIRNSSTPGVVRHVERNVGWHHAVWSRTPRARALCN